MIGYISCRYNPFCFAVMGKRIYNQGKGFVQEQENFRVLVYLVKSGEVNIVFVKNWV